MIVDAAQAGQGLGFQTCGFGVVVLMYLLSRMLALLQKGHRCIGPLLMSCMLLLLLYLQAKSYVIHKNIFFNCRGWGGTMML